MLTLLSRRRVVVGNKTETFRLIGFLVDKDLEKSVGEKRAEGRHWLWPRGQCRIERRGSSTFDRWSLEEDDKWTDWSSRVRSAVCHSSSFDRLDWARSAWPRDTTCCSKTVKSSRNARWRDSTFPIRSAGTASVNWRTVDWRTAMTTRSTLMTEDSRIEIRSAAAGHCCSLVRMDWRRRATTRTTSVAAVVEVEGHWNDWPFDRDLTFDCLARSESPADERSDDCPHCVDRVPWRRDCSPAMARTRARWNTKRSRAIVANSKVTRRNQWEMQNVLSDWWDDECHSRDWPVKTATDWNRAGDDGSLVSDREVHRPRSHCRRLPMPTSGARERTTVHSNDDRARTTRPAVDCEIDSNSPLDRCLPRHCSYCRRRCCWLSWRTCCSDDGFEEVGQLTLLLTPNLEESDRHAEVGNFFLSFEAQRKRKKTEQTRWTIYTLSCSPGSQMIEILFFALSLVLSKAHPFAKLDEMRLHSIVVSREYPTDDDDEEIDVQREEDLGLGDVFDFFTLTLSLSLSWCLSYAPSFASTYVSTGTMQHKERKKTKESNMHTHTHTTWKPWLSAVVVCIHSETNKHMQAGVCWFLQRRRRQKSIEEEMKNFFQFYLQKRNIARFRTEFPFQSPLFVA